MTSSNALKQQRPGRGSHLDPHNLHEHDASCVHRRPSATSQSNEGILKPIGEYTNRPNASSSASRSTMTSTSTRFDNRTSNREVRTLPSWIDSYDDADDPLPSGLPRDNLLSSPSRAQTAHHHYTPSQPSRRMSKDGYVDIYDETPKSTEKKHESGFFGHKEPVRGRKWDHVREGDPVIMQSNGHVASSPWRTYIKSSMYGPAPSEDNRKVNEEFLQQQTPGFDRPWRGDMDGGNDPEKSLGLLNSKKRRRSLLKRWQQIILMHPLIPLIFRVLVFTTSVIALGLSGSIYKLSGSYAYPQNPSTIMAIVVDVVAIPYILWITWDEYTGKPLGLRPPKAKIRLVLLDLFFIIFESANLALSFAALVDDHGSCRDVRNGYNDIICARVRTLSGILMIALISWSVTFTISIFRVVERVGGRDESE